MFYSQRIAAFFSRPVWGVPFSDFFPFIWAMAAVVILSNFLVQFPVSAKILGFDLSDFFTWGAFTYPFSFLVTDLVNRRYGASISRLTAFIGFVFAVIFAVIAPALLLFIDLGTFNFSVSRLFRVAVASGSAFLFAQFLDIAVFNFLRTSLWWRAPVYGSVAGSVCDTLVFFFLSFSSVFFFIGPDDSFASELVPSMSILGFDTPRWVWWAVSDFSVKLFITAFSLIPYRLALSFWFRNGLVLR